MAFSDGDWLGKAIGAIAGLFLCLIPLITSIIGFIKQTGLQKSVEDDIQMAFNGDM